MKTKKFFLLTVMAACVGSASAHSNNQNLFNENDSIEIVKSCSDQDMQPLSPTYLDGAYYNSGWGGNWFLSVKGGINAFVGSPVGCGDFGDRIMPLLNVSVGKWFTPYVGARISYQGLKMKDSNIQSVAFQNVHADLLYNVSSHLRKDVEYLPKWDFIPYVGVGIIHNSHSNHKPFGFSYGIIGRYRIAKRIHLTGEIGGTTTFRDFDGVGEDNKFGDNLLHASVGFSVTIGKNGWKKVVDAQPYINQNEQLINGINELRQQNAKLSKALNHNELAIVEMRKVLEIEGLLGKYKLHEAHTDKGKIYPKNNYSGLNSLRERLRNRNWNGDMNNYKPMLSNGSDSTSLFSDSCLINIREGKTFIGAPILFFFKIRTSELTDKSQIANIKEIAKVAKKYNLRAKIVGSADNATGSEALNDKLSMDRATFIAEKLKDYGVKEDMIEIKHRGGIDVYKPIEVNRNTCVLLYTK